MGTLTYEIGSGQMPKWVACKVMAYRKMNGSTAYEFWGEVKRIDLRPGDLLIKDGQRIGVERKGNRRNGSKKVSEANSKA